MHRLTQLLTAALAIAAMWQYSPLTLATNEQAWAAQVLDWPDLLPPGWEPPLIAPAYDQPGEQQVDAESLVAALGGQQVRLPGFLRPIVYSDQTVSEFLLVPFLPHHLKQHAHLEPNQVVYVVLAEPTMVDNPFSPLWVSGTIELETSLTDEGPAGYKMTSAVLRPYEYEAQ